jgi:hypothetical protein
MGVIRAQQDGPSLRGTTPRIPRDSLRCGVLIMGFRCAHIFAATEVFISADTLGDEEAIRAWLAQHDIHVMHTSSRIASTDKDSTKGIGSSQGGAPIP